jgi:chromosome segregation ATPase
MIDMVMAANSIRGDMVYRLMDGLTAAYDRNNGEIAYLQACNDWLARDLERLCTEYSTVVDSANLQEADYRRRIADLEQQITDLQREHANLKAKYKERDASTMQENTLSHSVHSLRMSMPPDAPSGSLLADYNAVLANRRAQEGK